MSTRTEIEALNRLVHGLYSLEGQILHKQDLILDKLNGVKHYMPGDCELCMECKACYTLVHKEHKDRTVEVCASCSIEITNPGCGRESKWRREPINR
jgi:hypothetical protein